MSTNYHFKPLGLTDLSDMMEIERDIFDAPWSASMMRDSLLAAHCQVWGVLDDNSGELIAYGVISIILDEVELLTIGVSQHHRRQGYGRLLLGFLMDKSRESKAEQIFLEVPVSNKGAVSLYSQFGFEKTGVRENYYHVPGRGQEDAILMSAALLVAN